MNGATNLPAMLATLEVTRRPGVYTFVSLDDAPGDVVAEATVVEAEGTTLIVPAAVARERGWPVGFEAAWLTLDVHSALEAVGLTAAVAVALAEADVPCNVIAGAYHDHLLVPVDKVETAIAAIAQLRHG